MDSDNNLIKSIIKSLDGKDKKLLLFIPYFLQDLWEIGSSQELIIQILNKHKCINTKSKVLDLGCGKGAISVNIAREIGCQVLGIDAMPAFIEEANYWADKFHQTHLCTFEINDICTRINNLNNFDVIILGSIGPVFGNIQLTLKTIQPVLNKNGHVILDDGYIPEKSTFKNENYFKQSEAERQIHEAGYKITEAFILEDDFLKQSDTDIYQKIEKRSQQLIEKFPQEKQLFEDYLENQRIENDILENKVVCVTWLLQKSD